MDAFGRNDHEEILACLTDDVEWLVPGAFHVHGKAAFDGEIEGEAFVRTRLEEAQAACAAENPDTRRAIDMRRVSSVNELYGGNETLERLRRLRAAGDLRQRQRCRGG